MAKPQQPQHIFVDFENVHDVDLSVIADQSIRVTIMVGPKQTKIDTTLVEQMLARPGMFDMVRLNGAGKNALDFALAYYLGRAAGAASSDTSFAIVSRDTGFDPLIEHLRHVGVDAQRLEKFGVVNGRVGQLPDKPADESLAELMCEALSETKGLPKTRKKLESFLESRFAKKRSKAEIKETISDLEKRGWIRDSGGEIKYWFNSEEKDAGSSNGKRGSVQLTADGDVDPDDIPF